MPNVFNGLFTSGPCVVPFFLLIWGFVICFFSADYSFTAQVLDFFFLFIFFYCLSLFQSICVGTHFWISMLPVCPLIPTHLFSQDLLFSLLSQRCSDYCCNVLICLHFLIVHSLPKAWEIAFGNTSCWRHARVFLSILAFKLIKSNLFFMSISFRLYTFILV